MVDPLFVGGLVAALLAPVLGGLAALWRPGASVAGALVAWAGSAVLLYGALGGAEMRLSLGTWMDIGALTVGQDLRVDLRSAVLLLGTHSLGLAAHLFAADYLRDEAAWPLRWASATAAAAALLFCADNYPLLLAGWTLLGAMGHLRAGADYATGDRVARIWPVLRAGDIFLWVAVIALCAEGQVAWGGDEAARWVGWCLLLAGASRAAQYPGHFWLTRMRDPGALLQAFGVGVAGIYLLVRTTGVWNSYPVLVYAAAGIGVATTIFCTAAALAARDAREVLAHVMASQLGLTLAALACGGEAGVSLHLAIAGIGLGLCLVGAAYLAQGEGDGWNSVALGRWRKLLPLPYWTAVLGALIVAGLPPLAGVWGYGVLLAGLFAGGGLVLWVGGCLLLCVAALGPLRLVFLLTGAAEAEKPQAFRTPGAGAQMALIGLAALAIGAGALGYPPGVGFFAGGGLRWELLAGPGVASLAATLIAWLVYGDQVAAAEQKASAWQRISAEGFYGERLLRALVGRPVLGLARLLRDADALVCELAASASVATGVRGAGWALGRLQGGQVRFYAVLATLGFIAALAYLAMA